MLISCSSVLQSIISSIVQQKEPFYKKTLISGHVVKKAGRTLKSIFYKPNEFFFLFLNQ